jgi:exodeoxyribonuclease V alpha subunit
VVDETSMVDVPLMNALTKAIPAHAGLLLVGDVDQLALGGIRTGAGRHHRLRPHSCGSTDRGVPAGSREPDRGERPPHQQGPDAEVPKAGEDSDFFFVEITDPEEGVPKIIQMIKERMPRRFGLDPMKDVQVLCPMNRGVLGARNLNIQLQEVLNPNPPAKVERFGWRFSPGDRVMETQNDYDREVFNGDLGTGGAD